MIKDLKGSKFRLAVFMIICGIGMLFICIFIPPIGQIHGSILGAAGELFITAGGILGIGQAFLDAIRGISKATDQELERINKKSKE